MYQPVHITFSIMSPTCCSVFLRFVPSMFAWAWTLIIVGGSGTCSTSKDGLGLFLHMGLTAVYLINIAIGPKRPNANEDHDMYGSVWGRFSPVALACWFLYGFSFLYFMWTHNPFGFEKDTQCLYYQDWFGFIGIAAMTLFGIFHVIGVVTSLCLASRMKRPSFSIQAPLLFGENRFADSL